MVRFNKKTGLGGRGGQKSVGSGGVNGGVLGRKNIWGKILRGGWRTCLPNNWGRVVHRSGQGFEISLKNKKANRLGGLAILKAW